MKIKNLMGAVLALAFAAVLPGAVRAEVEQGVIYSVDLVEGGKYGGRVPTEGNPLIVNEKAVIRVRLVNANWQSPPATRVANPRPWFVAPRYPGMEKFYPLQLGLMLGGQPVYADYLETQEVVNPEAYYTDLYFSYTVKSGDLALPAYLMDTAGKPAGEGSQPEYSLLHADMWMITNADGKDVTEEGLFHFTTMGSGMTPVPGEPQNYTPSGRKMGLYVKTIDLDKNYVEPAETEGGKDIWRKIYQGMTTTTTILPSVAVDGLSEANVFMYVWCDDTNVAAPLKTDGAQTVTDTFGDKTYTRSVLPVLVPIGASSVSFKLQGVGVGETKVRMSSSLNLVADDMGNLYTNWVERIIEVVEPPAPFVAFNLIDKSGNPLLAPVTCPTGEGYKDYVAALTITLSKAPEADVIVHLNPKIGQSAADAKKGEDPGDIFADGLLNISTTTDGTPWVLDPDDPTDKVTFHKGETSKTLYIYGLGSSKNLSNYGVLFKPSTTGPGADMFKDDDHSHTANLIVKYAKPILLKPTAEDRIEDAMAGQSYSLDVRVEDSYKFMRTDEGYTFKYRIKIAGSTGSWQTLDNVYVDPDTGDGTIDIDFEDEGEGTVEIYALNADGSASPQMTHVNVPVTVSAPKKAWAELDRPGGYYAEGETAKVKFFVSQKTPGSKVYYAFLVPVEGSVDSTNKFNSTGFSTSVPATGGCPLAPGSLDSGDGVTEITCLDGAAIGQYDVFICTTLSYNKSKSAGYSAGRLVINATNVAPHVVSVSMGGTDIDESGAIVADPIAQGVNKAFRVSIGDTEPSQLDLEATGDDAFLTQWKFGSESLDWESVYGNPNLAATVTNHTFTSPGQHVVKVRVQDKDMRKNGNRWSPEFTFTVTVLDAPSISITPALEGKTTYDETDIGANASTFKVDLSVAPSFSGIEDRLYLDLTVTALGDTTKYGADDCVLSKTRLEYRSGVKTGQTFYLKELDGTTESAASGFRITAKVSADSATDTEGKTWDAGEIEINVLNVNPDIVMPAEQPKDGDKVIPYVTTVGERLSLAWALKDVVPDKKAMTVTWTTSEGRKMTYIQGEGEDTETVKYLDDVMSGTHEFWFNSSGESKSVTVMAQDKDGGVASRTIYYTIAASKTLEIVPHGPPSGNGTALSARYQDKASGLGAGRVWAKNPATIEDWVFTFNCGLDSNWRIYGAGYTNGEHDVRSTPDFDYTYAPADGKDSFLYAWLQIVQEKDAAKPTDAYLAVVPEHRNAANSGTLINLPAEEAKNGGFASTIAEAIFAKEYLASDNMGDINQDGVPDIYVKKYEFGVIDADGNVAGDDLKAITVANETGNIDADFLPASGTSAYGSLIPGLPESWVTLGKPFDAVTEIRGYHEGLNDAPAQAGIGDVAPDRIYAVDGEWRDGECTISYVEYLAWQAFAAVNGLDPADEANWKLWSPERPTDPCSPDTDDDGFTDGYEYSFWYKAHVGYVENGVHRYLTGRAYDPRNPGEGKLISAAEIARLMDPLVKYEGEDAETRDSDNDGLPDKLEFEIGTNPFDFDTDGDGLPDGFEIMLGGTDPLLESTTKGVSDAMRNFDGDAMAFTTPYLEANGFVQPVPLTTDALFTFALVDPNGDTDGIQWYVGKSAPTNITVAADGQRGTSFRVGNVTYVTRGTVPVVTNVTDGAMGAATNLILAADLPKATTWATMATNTAPEGVEVTAGLIALMPTRIAAGTAVADIDADATYATLALGEDVEDVNAAWVYGRSVSGVTTGDAKANLGGFGMLAIGRYQDAQAGLPLAALPAQDDGVAYLHHFVYQEFGFDPRTAWNANTPLAPRWGKTVGSGETAETVANNTSASYGYAGVATRTREFTLYDEFLVLSFFLNNGKLAMADVTPTQAVPWEKIWSKYTTNGQGPNEPNWEQDNDHFKGRTAETASGDNGADTDLDGVPDGWELYIMAGPKQKGRYNLVAPYDDGIYSSFSPFVRLADSVSATDYAEPADRDDLSELQEYAGTDSCAYYCEPWGGNAAAFSATIVRPKEHVEWLNKFFPTDPWNEDTDGDGLKDNEFVTQGNFKSGNFHYGTPVDNGKMVAIPGGGLNPCTVDTDHDGLPDKWEAQFAGQTVYAGDDKQVMTGKDGTEGNPLQGLCDGMDGTVWDAYNSPRINNAEENYKVIYNVNGAGADQVVDRDYDRDGLENWQEYMTGAMRVWRYDDPLTGWSYIPDDLYWFLDPTTGVYVFSPDYVGLSELTGEEVSSDAEFWYKTLFDSSSALYNPHFVTGTSPSSQYFSRVTNGWDPTFTEQGTYYMFYDRVNDAMIKDSWGFKAAPTKYICTSPIVADTDKDGMDDGYELFHGMNPLLGAPDVLLESDGPCDVVFDAWYKKSVGSPVSALDNPWMEALPGQGANPAYDFTVHPWLNGIVDADPDGDDIRNQDEAIMPLVAPSTTWLHTDPTPLWMTDSSYGESLVNRFFRLPIALNIVPVPASIVYDGTEYPLVDRDGFNWGKSPSEPPQYIAPFVPDFWMLSASGAANWMYSFEENEGYDSDHDSGSDYEELQGKFRSATDPQDADSPRRRQAMHFGGPEDPSALQTMPFVEELYPRRAMGYPDDMSFLQYTVECWVKPESAADATVLERTSFTDPSHCADERYVRRNFAIMIRNGKWCTAFDSNGTLDGSVVQVLGKTDAKVGEWTHVAATYDANRLTLYVNGGEDGYVLSNLKPEYGSSAVTVFPAGSGSAKTNGTVDTSTGSLEALKGTAHAYWFDSQYPLNAFLIGASFANAADGSHLDVTRGMGWKRYRDFFKGYVDEVRVWDGARSSGDIAADVSSRKRYTREDALANRDDFYDQWVAGRVRYNKDGSGKDLDVIPELRFHWAFDSIPGAENAAAVAQAPHGFLDGPKAPWSSPEGYEIPWWSGIVGAYGSVYEGERNWVPWIPNTVTHLPRFDLTTLDSSYWSENYAGDKAGTYKFARTAEPVSKWTQYVRNGTEAALSFQTTGRRFWLSHNTGSNGVVTLDRQFEFTGRHLNQTGDDLLPLGGAFAKYVDSMWDDQGASSMWEQTGNDADNDGLPDWWQEYAEQNYREGVPGDEDITWNTMIWYEVGGVKIRMTAGEAYQRDLAKGAYVDAKGEVHSESEDYKQTADLDKDGMPDWWEEMNGLHGGTGNLGAGHADGDIDNDGLSNYQEYLASVVYGFYRLDPLSAYSTGEDQKVTDYFLPITNDFPLTVNDRTFEEPRNFMRGEYLGAVLTDHDFMENWWENKYAKNYASAWIYDPWDDTDGDGWSNFAECRAFMWGGAFASDIIDRWLDGETTENNNRVLDYPRPAIGVKITYANDQINDIDGKGLIVRTRTTGKRVDATFVIHGTDAETVEAQDHMIGSFYEGVTIHGFLNPGWLLPNDVKLYMVQISAANIYTWRYYWEEDYKNKNWDNYWKEDSGSYEAYRSAKRSYRWVRLISPEIQWGDPIAMVHSDKDAHFGELLYSGEAGAANKIGTIDFYTGEYTLDLAKLRSIDSTAENSIFKFAYSYKIGKNWPQTLWLSDTFDANNAEDETTGNFVNGSGRVREGLNTIEAFIDYNNNGRWDSGEPYGMVKDVPVGWHKVPEVTLELTDESLIVPRTLIPAASTSTGDDQFGAGQQDAAADKDGGGGATTATKVRIVRDSINGIPSSAVVISGLEFVMDDRAYLTEADVMSATSPDLDWDTLVTDADKLGIVNIASATYHIESYGDSADDSTVAQIGQPFTRRFSNARPVVMPVAPLADAPVYTAAPTFQFTADKDTTAFAIQVADEDGTIIYESGVQMLGGRASVTVGNYAYKFTAPIYANASIITNGAPVLVDGKSYKWRAVAFNAKYNTAKSSDYCVWTDFQMDVGNVNRYPVNQTTGYGKVGAIVRYFGPAKTNDLTNLIVVEAFENADFTGQALAQIRVADLADLTNVTARIDTLDCTNAVLAGLDIGTVYLRAYIDLNNNGKWDRYEPWGYANMVGKYGTDYSYPPIYNPKGIEVGASAANVEKPNFTTIFIEDTDLNKNEIPDCLEDWPDTIAGDWWTWAGTTEDHPEYAVAGDVMAYAEVDRVMVVFEDGTSALVMKGVLKRPVVGDLAASCNEGWYESWYRYGDQIGLGLPFHVFDTELRITAVDDVKVVLVHAQVYDEFGYSMKTANWEAFANGVSVNTKAFTAADKKHLLSYLEAIDFIDPNDLPTNTDKTFEDYLDELARTDAISASRLWQKYSLKVGDPDNNRDGVADGWNLYVMFGPATVFAANNPAMAPCTPWSTPDVARDEDHPTPGGEGLTWVQEYDGGHYPTDPWQWSTIGDRFRDGYGEEQTISDKDAYAYFLKHYAGEEGDKYLDFDNDGLANYDEYDIMKNNNRALAADNMFSYFGSETVPALADQCVPDYFLKSQRRNEKASLPLYPIYNYLGFDYTSHDFIESWWKDQYQAILPNSQEKYVDRTRFETYDDPDGDGWDNWSEARAKTDPTKVSQSAIDGYTINEFPVPVVELSLTKGDSTGASNSAIVVQALLSPGASGQPDATWIVGGRAAGAQEKFLGFNPAIAKRYNLGGSIVPGTFRLEFKDLTADHETYLINTNDSKKTRISSLKVSASGNVWADAIIDTKVDNNSSKGYLVDRNDGNTIYGTIDYETGDVMIDFAAVNEDNGGSGYWRTWNEGQTECVVTYYWKSYVRATWTTKATSLSASPLQSVILSDAETGRLREGLNTFAAFADANGNGAYDPGEAFGCVKDVQVGFDRVVDLSINLTKTSPVLPRFNPMDIGEGGSTNGAVTITYKGKPVISDLGEYQTVRIVRWEINGDECAHRMVLSKTAETLGTITEADVLSDNSFDLDWNYLEIDAAKIGYGLKDISTITYAVFVDGLTLSEVKEENVTGWIVKGFPGIRGKATPVAPLAGYKTAIVTATRPTFEFWAPEGYPAFAFELRNEYGNVVFESTEHIGAKNAAGNVTYRPPVFFEENGEYTWRVAMLNAKYRAAGDWSEDAAFTVELAKGKVEDTDKGALDVVVRYYGDATGPIIVQAFRTADFTGVPEGQTVVYDTGVFDLFDPIPDCLDSYVDTNTVNAKIYGLAPGDYYICAFIDETGDLKRRRWESWGYVNNVGTDKRDLYTPVATKVMRNDTSTALLFIEDADCDNDGVPDWMDPPDGWDWPYPPPPYIPPVTPPVTPPSPPDVPPVRPPDVPPWFPQIDPPANDVMAYEDLKHTLLVKIGKTDDDPASQWYAVMDLAGEGWKLRDSDIPLQTFATNIESLVSTWTMGAYTGIGTNVTFTGDERVWDTKFETVRLIHAQVYAKNGYNTLTANGQAYAAGKSVNTKPFTFADKYYVCRYLENIGVEGFSEAKMIAEVEKAIATAVPADVEWAARKVWRKYALDPDYIDMDRNDVDDGWEMYVMFGVTDLGVFTDGSVHEHWTKEGLAISPWNPADGMLVAPGAGSQLKLVEEFDGGFYPTDPWHVDTDKDGVIDFYAYQYCLKGDQAGEDLDGDGLSNYAEYLISEVFKVAKLDPQNPKTDGSCVDYFRKMGDLYVGEIFTDHDQVDDGWEGAYDKFANRYVYDPDEDLDRDGWSNYAEFRAGSDPTTGDAYGVDEYTRAEYPVPVIEAKVIYNGNDVNLGSIVFKAWNDAKDPDMTSAPDAIWTIGNGKASETTATTEDGKSGSTLQAMPPKYVGRKPSGVQRYALGGGTVADGTIEISFLNKQFTDVSYPSNAVTGKISSKPAEKPGDPSAAKWYLAARDDGNGHVVTLTGERIGTVDYAHGVLTVDFGNAAICGPTTGDRTTGYAYATEFTATEGNAGYDAFSFDDAHVLVKWQAKLVGLTADGTYTLGDADPVTETAKSHGHVREGLNTFICFADTVNANGAYDPGEPFGVVRGVDVGWQGAKFTVELTETSPITDRIRLTDNADDREATIEGSLSAFINDRMLWAIPAVLKATNDAQRAELIAFYSAALSNRVQRTTVGAGMKSRIRVVRYGIDDWFCYSAGVYDSGLGMGYDQRVVMEKEFDMEGRDFVNEADFLGPNAFDIDWGTMTGEIVDANGKPVGTSTTGPLGAGLDVTNMTYLVVKGDGAKDFRGSGDTNTTVSVVGVISRRFELTRHVPKIVSPSVGAYVHGARPTFRWSIPDEEPWAARFGSSYTAFRIQISKANGGSVYDSGIRRAPAQTEKGVFEWTADAFAGDQLPVGNYTWKVSMYNSKFRSDAWSLPGSFSIATGTQQETDDHNYSSIDVSVKYTGPALVLNEAGFVRVQAFETADFSGTPVAQTRITDTASVMNTGDIRKNGTLVGLPFGTYFVRAYIDTNKNGVKDDWESWGGTKEPVTLTTYQPAPIDGLYIEDADTDKDWLPDAWEYAKYGNLSKKGAEIDPEGRIVLKQVVCDDLAKGQANISKFLSGASLTFFQNIGNVSLALGIDAVTEKSIAEIRAMVEKNIDPTSVKITSLSVDATSGKVYLTVAAKATDSIAGYLLEPLYEIPKSTDVTIKIYRKENLATDDWTLEKTVTKTIESTLSAKVEVDTGVNFNSGFYKVEIVRECEEK